MSTQLTIPAGVVLTDLAADASTLPSTHDAIKAGPGAKARAAAARPSTGAFVCDLAG